MYCTECGGNAELGHDAHCPRLATLEEQTLRVSESGLIFTAKCEDKLVLAEHIDASGWLASMVADEQASIREELSKYFDPKDYPDVNLNGPHRFYDYE